jgi:hypothetical protein
MSDCVIDQEPFGECECLNCEEYCEALYAINDEGTAYEALVAILKTTDIPKLNAIKHVDSFIDLGVLHDLPKVSAFRAQALKFLKSL